MVLTGLLTVLGACHKQESPPQAQVSQQEPQPSQPATERYAAADTYGRDMEKALGLVGDQFVNKSGQYETSSTT